MSTKSFSPTWPKDKIHAFDTETTGLRLYQQDRPFLFSWATAEEPEGDAAAPAPLPAMADPETAWIIMNAPFDLRALEATTGQIPAGPVLDLQTLSRLHDNRHLRNDLESITRREGLEKSDEVERYIKQHKLYTVKTAVGKKTKESVPHYDRVPASVIVPYARQDAAVTRAAGLSLLAKIEQMDAELPEGLRSRPLMRVVQLESEVTKELYAMIREGIGLDVDYCRQASEHYARVQQDCEAQWTLLTGRKLVDSFKALQEVFKPLGIKSGMTKKGQPSYTDKILQQAEHPLAELVRTHRDATKRNSTFFLSFLEFCGADGRIHAEFQQNGARTGRMSCKNPNLQQLSGDEEEEGLLPEDQVAFPVRRAFVPRPGFVFVSLDFKQQEYRLLADMAGEMELIARILKGEDVHQATADLVGVTRKQAKTLNFGLLYGMGVKTLAAALGCSLVEAKELKARYFYHLPAIQSFIKRCSETMRSRGWVKAWSGRVFRNAVVTDAETGETYDLSYKATNAVIQGGSADITKQALVNAAPVARQYGGRLLVPIHDELVFELPAGTEAEAIPALVSAMRSAYTPRMLPMDCSAAWSDKNLHDLVDWDLPA